MRDPNGATCPIVVLPVEIFLFEGVKTDYGNVLKWSTASEQNSSFFTLERSVDGIDWLVIGNVVAAGNSQSELDYQFIDVNYRETVNYYRLKQTDIDGTVNKHNGIVALDNSPIGLNPIVGRYNVIGQPVEETYKGVQLLLFEDGSTQRIFKP